MKKTILVTAILGLVALGSCCDKHCKDENTCCKNECKCECKAGDKDCKKACDKGEFAKFHKHCKEMGELEKRWAKFDSLSVDEQKALIAEKKAKIDERDSMIKAAREEFEAKWANFEKLSVEEQKMLLDAKINFHHNGRFSHGEREVGPQCKGDRCHKEHAKCDKPCK